MPLAFFEVVSVVKTNLFDAKLVIERLPSFSVPKITVVQHVELHYKKLQHKLQENFVKGYSVFM